MKDTKFNKNQILILGIIVVLIVGIVSMFFFINKDQNNDDLNSSDIQEYMPDMTKEEIDEIAKQQLDEESAAIADEVLNNLSESEIDEILEDNEETGIIVYRDKEGNLVEYDTNTEDLNKSEEELNAETDEMLKSLSEIAAGNLDQAETNDEPAVSEEETNPDKYIGETTLPGDQPNPEVGTPEFGNPLDRINTDEGGLVEIDDNTSQSFVEPSDSCIIG